MQAHRWTWPSCALQPHCKSMHWWYFLNPDARCPNFYCCKLHLTRSRNKIFQILIEQIPSLRLEVYFTALLEATKPPTTWRTVRVSFWWMMDPWWIFSPLLQHRFQHHARMYLLCPRALWRFVQAVGSWSHQFQHVPNCFISDSVSRNVQHSSLVGCVELKVLVSKRWRQSGEPTFINSTVKSVSQPSILIWCQGTWSVYDGIIFFSGGQIWLQ
jgi:hypothetical protein